MPFFNLRDPEGDFFLFLLQLLQRHDFIADFGKIHRLRTTLAAEIDFAFLQNPLFVAQSASAFFCRRIFSPISRRPVRMKLTGKATCRGACAKRPVPGSGGLPSRRQETRAVGKPPLPGKKPILSFLRSGQRRQHAQVLQRRRVARDRLPLAISFSKRRMILPLRVFGSASANRTSSGFAIAPMWMPRARAIPAFTQRAP